MAWGFLGALASAHGQKAVRNLTDAIVDMDPATASAAQLQVMEQDLDKVGQELTKCRADAERERTEFAAVTARFNQMSSAATALNTRYEAETDPTKKADLEKSLNGLLTTLETIKSEMDSDKSHYDQAQSLVQQTSEIYEQKAAELRTAKANLASAGRELQRAKMESEQASTMAERSAEIAGLRDNKVGGLNAALDSMRRQTEQARGAAETNRLKAQVLTKADSGSMQDPYVLAALKDIQAPASNQSFADRLAALKTQA